MRLFGSDVGIARGHRCCQLFTDRCVITLILNGDDETSISIIFVLAEESLEIITKAAE